MNRIDNERFSDPWFVPVICAFTAAWWALIIVIFLHMAWSALHG